MWLYLCRAALWNWYRAMCLSVTFFALLVLRMTSCWVFVIIITLSVCCNSSVIWKVSDVVSSLEGRRRRWSTTPQAEQFFWCVVWFFFFKFPPCHILLHHVLLNYANIYQVISHEIQTYVTRHGIAGWNLPEFWNIFLSFTFHLLPQNKGWSKPPRHSLGLRYI